MHIFSATNLTFIFFTQFKNDKKIYFSLQTDKNFFFRNGVLWYGRYLRTL